MNQDPRPPTPQLADGDIDALLPPVTAARTEQIGAKKVRMDVPTLLVLSQMFLAVPQHSP
jgi:hypothetical protein